MVVVLVLLVVVFVFVIVFLVVDRSLGVSVEKAWNLLSVSRKSEKNWEKAKGGEEVFFLNFARQPP